MQLCVMLCSIVSCHVISHHTMSHHVTLCLRTMLCITVGEWFCTLETASQSRHFREGSLRSMSEEAAGDRGQQEECSARRVLWKRCCDAEDLEKKNRAMARRGLQTAAARTQLAVTKEWRVPLLATNSPANSFIQRTL